jgi:predicted DNA binding CopG/RHH family protein
MSGQKNFLGWGSSRPAGTMRELRALSAPTSTDPGTNGENSPSPQPEVRDSPSIRTDQLSADAASHNDKNVASSNDSVASMLATKTPHAASMLATKTPISKTVSAQAASHKKDRHAPGKQQLNVRIANDIFQQIKEFCAKNNIPIQDFIEISASRYIENVASHKTENVARKLAHDDLMIRKTHDDIIMLYTNYTGNRWKPADDRSGERFNTTDRRHIELGLLQTLLNARGKRINSFSYFTPEIEIMMTLQMSPESLGVMLERRRQQWKALKVGRKD